MHHLWVGGGVTDGGGDGGEGGARGGDHGDDHRGDHHGGGQGRDAPSRCAPCWLHALSELQHHNDHDELPAVQIKNTYDAVSLDSPRNLTEYSIMSPF